MKAERQHHEDLDYEDVGNPMALYLLRHDDAQTLSGWFGTFMYSLEQRHRDGAVGGGCAFPGDRE